MAYKTTNILISWNKCLLFTTSNVFKKMCTNSIRSFLVQCQKTPNIPLWRFHPKLEFHSTSNLSNDFDKIADDDNVRYIDLKRELKTMKFRELKDLATQQYNLKGRNLVKIKVSGEKIDANDNRYPTFRTLTIKELEESARKNRQQKQQNQKAQYFEIIDPSKFLTSEQKSDTEESLTENSDTIAMKSGKIRYKRVDINAGIADHDLQVAANRVIKFLSNGTTIVTLNIRTKGKSDEAASLEKDLKSYLGSDATNVNLVINIS